MAQYLKISSPVGGLRNSGLKRSIIYIGKRYGKLANRDGYKDKEYFKCGIKVIAKLCGAFCKTAILCMVEPKKTKNPDNKKWCYHKQVYGKAYGHIIRLLHKCPPSEKDIVKELLNNLYLDICKKLEKNNGLAHVCSNALLFWQKDMLGLHEIKPNVSINDRKEAGEILRKIIEVDKPLPMSH
jgi:hypothetical protein